MFDITVLGILVAKNTRLGSNFTGNNTIFSYFACCEICNSKTVPTSIVNTENGILWCLIPSVTNGYIVLVRI
jgi:hypothetical protein